MDKVFPIKKGVACQLKWTWNTVRLMEATSACCHRVEPIPLNIDDFDNFHNDPVWVSHREMQLQGKFPQQGCQYCERIEAQGGTSDRMLHLNEKNVYPPELDTDPEAVRTTPRILEVFLNNACNMSCIYCDESNSTRIQKENEKFGHIVPGVPFNEELPLRNIISVVPRTNRYQEVVEKFFGYLGNNYHHLRRLQVLGGEPFYQKEFFRLVDFVCQNKNPELKLNIVSNLKVSKKVLEEFMENMKAALIDRRIARVDLTASIDCFGPEQEYVRHGMDLEQWKENFEYMLSHKWLYVSINNTITSMTIKTMPELLEYINEKKKTRHIHHAFGIVDFRPYFHPGIMGPGFFDKDFEKIISLMSGDEKWDVINRNYMTGIQKAINSYPEDMQQQYYLRQYLDEIDRRRSLNWREVFPWLAEKLDKVDYVVQ